MSRLRTTICLFRNDLRVEDNEVLMTAQRTCDYLLPLYCFDPHHFKVNINTVSLFLCFIPLFMQGTWHFNFPKTGVHRTKFLLESVQNLRLNLQKLKTDLVLKNVSPVDGIRDLVELCDKVHCPVGNVVYQKEVTYEETKVEAAIKTYCQSRDIKVTEVWGSTLYNKAGSILLFSLLLRLSDQVVARFALQFPRPHPGHLHSV